ncbi:uracil-DNA glycosylase family protein [Shewanella rhizosphaerae]|uniref:uracil-DNA glycosylase family protein n=1 Tax=Shewanella rhizosphaerae TaxID=2864207 RepID=UPI001C65D96C|nr:uracil-DNA glycosylase family protein [Shewanella rhizosphaerae]QYK11549.1 uracil-DNA glycosylase family protein [Shewanella rhizosphaerae]
MESLEQLLERIARCQICQPHLSHKVRPVLQAESSAKVLIVGQAPGTKAAASGQPFDDPSGDRLREWLGVSREQFYDPNLFAIVPMGFCYPGKGRSGDLPPRAECAPAWREALLAHLKNIQLTLVIGRYAQAYHFGKQCGGVTECVQGWQLYGNQIMPLPHPSPRNNLWLRRNPWFETELLPVLKARVASAIAQKRL